MIGERNPALEKLGAPAIAFRAVVGLDLEQSDAVTLLGGLVLPPGLEAVDDDVAGLGGAAEGQVQLARILVHDTERGVLLPAAHVVVGGSGVATGATTPRVVADLDRGLAVHTHSHDASVVTGLVFGLEIGEDGIGFRDFFWGLALSTGRSR